MSAGTHVIACSSCTFYDRIIRREVRRNEQRLRRGDPPDMRGIDKAKAGKAICAENGHHDPHAGPDSRYGR